MNLNVADHHGVGYQIESLFLGNACIDTTICQCIQHYVHLWEWGRWVRLSNYTWYIRPDFWNLALCVIQMCSTLRCIATFHQMRVDSANQNASVLSFIFHISTQEVSDCDWVAISIGYVAFYGSYLTRVKVCKLPLCYVAKQWLATMLYQELSLPPSGQPKLPIKCQVIINPATN